MGGRTGGRYARNKKYYDAVLVAPEEIKRENGGDIDAGSNNELEIAGACERRQLGGSGTPHATPDGDKIGNFFKVEPFVVQDLDPKGAGCLYIKT